MFRDMIKACKNYYTTSVLQTKNHYISNIQTSKIRATEDKTSFKVCSLKFSCDDDEFFCGFENGVLQLRHMNDGRILQSYHNLKNFDISAMKASKRLQTHYLFSGNTNGDIFVINVGKQTITPFAYERENEINCMDVNLDHAHLISAGKDAAVRIYDLTTSQLVERYGISRDRDHCDPANLKNHTMRIFDAKFQPNNRNICATGGLEDVVKIWDLRIKYGLVRNLPGPRIRGESIVFYKDELILGSCRINKGIQRWDFGHGKLISNFHIRNNSSHLDGMFVQCMKLLTCRNGDFIVVGGTGSSSVAIVSLRNQTTIAHVPTDGPVRDMDVKNVQIVSGSRGGHIHMIRVK